MTLRTLTWGLAPWILNDAMTALVLRSSLLELRSEINVKPLRIKTSDKTQRAESYLETSVPRCQSVCPGASRSRRSSDYRKYIDTLYRCYRLSPSAYFPWTTFLNMNQLLTCIDASNITRKWLKKWSGPNDASTLVRKPSSYPTFLPVAHLSTNIMCFHCKRRMNTFQSSL